MERFDQQPLKQVKNMLYFVKKIIDKDQNRTISNACNWHSRSIQGKFFKIPAACVLLASSISVANAAKYEVSFKSAHGKYFVSEGNGHLGSNVNANRNGIGGWEKFHINDLDDTHCIRHGDVITINTGNDFHWQPGLLPQGGINNKKNLKSNWFYAGHIFNAPERIKFRLTNHSDANGCLADGDQISLQSVWTNKYVTAEPDGEAKVDRSQIGSWEKLTITIHEHMNPDPQTNLISQIADSPLWDLIPDTLNLIADGLSNIGVDVEISLPFELPLEQFLSLIDAIKDQNLDVIAGYHGARDEIPFGNTKVPQSDRAGWKTISRVVQGHIDQYANKSYNADDNWNPDNGKKDYARTILANLFNAEINGKTEALDYAKELINGAAAKGPWGIPGTDEGLFVKGDYDFAEVNLVAALWRFHRILGDTEIDSLLTLLVSEGKPGISPLGFFNHFSQVDAYGAPILFFTPETENHILKTEGTRYLKNKWIYDNNVSNDSKYNNASNGVGEFLVNYLDHTIRATVYEYNSIPYGESTLMALLNLEAYADGEVKRKARELLDTMMFKYAISSLNGTRWAPMRRKHDMLGYEHFGSDDTTSLARAHIVNNVPYILPRHWVNEGKLSARSGVVLYTALLPYRIPQATLNLMRSTDKSYFATLGRGKLSSPELYSAGPGYLLTAGGVIPDKAADHPHCHLLPFTRFGPSCSDQVMRSTTLSLTSLPIDNHKYGFRMSGGNHEGVASENNEEVSGVIYDENTQAGTKERYYSYADFNNTCVYENFACSAGRVWIPESDRLAKFSMHCEDEPNGVDIADLSGSTTEKNLNQWCIYTTPNKDLHIAVYSSNTLGTMALVQDRHASIAPSTLLNRIVAKNANKNVLHHQFTWPEVNGVPNGTISYDRHAHPENWAITGVSYAQQEFNDLSRDYQDWPQITLVSGSLNADIPEVNIALGKNVTQTSTAHGGAASRAVDGNTSGTYAHGSVSHTRNEDRPGWEIDLNGPKQVSGITLWNRTDCCTDRLSNFEVQLSTKWGIATADFSGTTVDKKLDIPLDIDDVYSIKIRLKGKGILSLAEVQVWSLEKQHYTTTTPANDDGGWNNRNTIFLDRHELNCGPFGLNSFKLYRPTETQIAYGYTCRNVDDNRISGWKSTPANAWGNGHNAYLDRHGINCGNKPIKAFRLTRPSGSQLSYAYKCGGTRLSQISNHHTGWNDNGNGNAIYLDRHNVSCPAGKALTYARLQNNLNGKIRYHYKCGTP